MTTEQKIKEIGSQYMLRLEQWRDVREFMKINPPVVRSEEQHEK